MTPVADRQAGQGTRSRLAVRILVTGQVQGVGFRPYVYRLARQCGLAGRVGNDAAGVTIDIEGNVRDLERFEHLLTAQVPAAAEIAGIRIEPRTWFGWTGFTIDANGPAGQPTVRVPRDLAVCPECRRELLDPTDRRHEYPFTNCTQCGPRYSIIEAMPYDRPATAMRRFAMCPPCTREYQAPADRRFHAQANACGACGPEVILWDRDGKTSAGPDSAIRATAKLLRRGAIVALKGLGGFQLLVRSDDTDAVARLRQRKQRPGKPLAVMAPSLASACDLVDLSTTEQHLLESQQNPIVVARRRESSSLSGLLAPRVGTLGVLLPTTPLHVALLTELGLPVVATSGNRGDEPIVTDEHSAIRQLAGIADAFLVHDRPIARRVDDSVVRVIAGKPVTLRLARGYAPLPLPALEGREGMPILTTGGHQKDAVAFWTGSQAVLGQHIGDLDHPDTRAAFRRTVDDLKALYEFEPAVIACDLHPDFFTTRWAAEQGKPVIQVQHHHAHAVASMAEHGLLDREVLAITWDGTGYGPDGTIWGGEFLRARRSGFERVASLLPFPLPGGEAAIRQPGRIAFGLLWVLLGEEAAVRRTEVLGLPARDGRALAAMIRRGVQTVWTSSVGRLFDGIAALVLGVHEVSYEGEAAMWLEAVADPLVTDAYPLPIRSLDARSCAVGDPMVPRSDWRPMLSAILDDLARSGDAATIAARFHNALAAWAGAVADSQPQTDVVLSGGCFQNCLLTERTLEHLYRAGRRVVAQGRVPPNDGGLAAGQLAVALGKCQRG